MHHLYIVLVFTVAVGVTTATIKSPHVFTLTGSSAHTVRRQSGNITLVTVNEFPILKRMSMRHLTLTSSGVREPHWHANGNELGYCLRGSALVSIFGNQGEHASFTITQGEMFYIPSGYLHHIENLDNSNETSIAEFILAFSHESPEDFGLSSAVSAMSDAVLGNTFQLPTNAWKDVVQRKEPTIIGTREPSTTVSAKTNNEYPNKFKFNVEHMSPSLIVAEGSARKATKSFWPVLENISMISLRIATIGMREPHWHPETAEMGYVVQGHARMTILAPGNEHRWDTYTLKPGDVYFVPRAYPHQIENIGNDSLHFLVFFDQSTPGDIGYTGSFSAFSREVIAATLKCPISKLPNYPFYPKDLLIVQRINPVDP